MIFKFLCYKYILSLFQNEGLFDIARCTAGVQYSRLGRQRPAATQRRPRVATAGG